MALNAVQFDAERPVNPVNGVSFDANVDEPLVAINPGRDAPVNPPVNPPVNNDGLRARQVVIVRLPGRGGAVENFELSLSRVRVDGSEESLDSEFTHGELLQVAARIEALALQGGLCNGAADFSAINTIKLNLHRGDRLHAFTLQRVRFVPNGGNLQEVQNDLYVQFMAETQQRLSEFGQTLASVHTARRERQEQLRHHGEHPAQQPARQP